MHPVCITFPFESILLFPKDESDLSAGESWLQVVRGSTDDGVSSMERRWIYTDGNRFIQPAHPLHNWIDIQPRSTIWSVTETNVDRAKPCVLCMSLEFDFLGLSSKRTDKKMVCTIIRWTCLELSDLVRKLEKSIITVFVQSFIGEPFFFLFHLKVFVSCWSIWGSIWWRISFSL